MQLPGVVATAPNSASTSTQLQQQQQQQMVIQIPQQMLHIHPVP